MKSNFVLLLLALLPGVLAAQGVQSKSNPSRIDWALLGYDATVRGLDSYTTLRALQCPSNHEVLLPGVIANHPTSMILYSATVVTLDWITMRTTRRRGHRWFGRIATVANASQDFRDVVHNFSRPMGSGCH